MRPDLVLMDVRLGGGMDGVQAQRMEGIGRLAGGIAHDFNNLLTIINGYCNLILDGMDADHAWHGFLTEVHEAGERAANLTQQLLAFSRKQMLQPKIVNLNVIVANLKKMSAGDRRADAAHGWR
jgi:signal transduction histidine kinase